MKILKKRVDKHGEGSITVRCEDAEDMWVLYNLVVGQWREPPALSISKVKQKEIGHSFIENRPSLSLFLVS